MNLKRKIAEYPNFPKKGILFRDFSPILNDPASMSFVVEEFSKKFHPKDVDVFVGIESRSPRYYLYFLFSFYSQSQR